MILKTFLTGEAAMAAPPAQSVTPASTTDAGATALETTEALTIDDLAAATRVPSRTIRFYAAKGLLPPPVMKGRVAFYGAPHRERLGLIAQLQDRGLKIDAIRDLMRHIDKGEVDVSEWLGVQAQMKSSWANDQPRTVSHDELIGLVGFDRVGLVAELVRLQLVERKGEVYLVPSPALLSMVTQLEQSGIDLETSVAAERIFRKHINRAVTETVSHFFTAAERGQIALRTEGAGILDTLRPTAMDAVKVVFAQEMEKALRERATSGKLPPRWAKK